MLKLGFYVPVEQKDSVKQALFAAGAGRIGNYDCCAWETLGQGQFRPLQGSQAFIGSVDELECVQEYRVEMVLADECKQAVIDALHQSHPYETPAFDLVRLENS